MASVQPTTNGVSPPTNGNLTLDPVVNERIQSNAALIWSGDKTNFEIRILRSADHVHAVLVELGEAMGMPRTTSGFYHTGIEAVDDVDKQLIYMVEELKGFEAMERGD